MKNKRFGQVSYKNKCLYGYPTPAGFYLGLVNFLRFNGLSLASLIAFFLQVGFVGKGQNRAFKSPLTRFDSTVSWEMVWQPIYPESNFRNGILIGTTVGKSPLYFWLSTSGALLSYRDSLKTNPIPVEKRNEYPFHSWEHLKKYALRVSKCPDEYGWIRCQWAEANSDRKLDEIWLCYGNSVDSVKIRTVRNLGILVR